MNILIEIFGLMLKLVVWILFEIPIAIVQAIADANKRGRKR